MRIGTFLVILLNNILILQTWAQAETLVVINKSEASASLIDVATKKIRKTVRTGQHPHEVVISSDGCTAVVTNYGNRERPGTSLTVTTIRLHAAQQA